MKKKITIFTPTYNRGYALPNAYKSLLLQKSKDFEWIIVDDGSTDNTRMMVNKWIKEKKIDIKYFYKENGGKPSAHNLGVEKANCELFFCLDSDDTLVSNAIKTILSFYDEVIDNDMCNGIIAYRDIKNMNLRCKKINEKYLTLEELNYKYKYNYDLMLIYKTKILKQYPFPIFKNEKFIQESFIYNQIDLNGKMLLIQESLYICEYLEDGYSKNINKIIKKNPIGYTICAKKKMETAKFWRAKIKGAIRYMIGVLILHEKGYIKNEKDLINKVIFILFFPISYIKYIKEYKGK